MQTLNIFAWWVASLYIYFLPPVPLPANSSGGWHPPTFKTKRPDKGLEPDAYYWLLKIKWAVTWKKR